MSSECIEVIVCRGPVAVNRRIAGSDQPATLAFERSQYK